MEMFWLKDKCVNGKGIFLTHMSDRSTKCFSANICGEPRLRMMGYLGKKISTARNFGSAIIGHQSGFLWSMLGV